MGKKDLSQVVAENGHSKVKEVFDKKFGSAGLTNNHGTPKVDLAGSGDHDGSSSDPINKEDVPLDFSRYNELEGDFPLPMTQAAFYGIAGHVVDAITEESEACREAVLMQFLCSLGNEIGR